MRRPPHNLDAERSAVGAALLNRQAREAVLDALEPSDCYDPFHTRALAGIAALHATGAGVDPVTVAAAMPPPPDGVVEGADLRALRTLAAQVPLSGNAKDYARAVAEAAAARRAIAVANEMAEAAWGANLDGVDAVLAGAPERVARPVPRSVVAMDAVDLLASPNAAPHPWVVPGLLRRMDRLVLTGGEGHGKMTLLRQLAAGVACGVHPLTGTAMVRGKALLVDLQEDAHDLRRELAPLTPDLLPGHLFVEPRPQGMNLLSGADARWLEALVAAHAPDLLVVGPLYKLYRATERLTTWAEETVETVTRTLDELRVRHGFAVAIEGHAGHDRDTWRVRGSSAWYAWPDFGLGLQPELNHERREVSVHHWRGDRHPNRPWPTRLYGGSGRRPWVPDNRALEALQKVDALEGTTVQAALDEEPF